MQFQGFALKVTVPGESGSLNRFTAPISCIFELTQCFKEKKENSWLNVLHKASEISRLDIVLFRNLAETVIYMLINI